MRRLSHQAASVLELFVDEPNRRRFGLEIIREASIPSGVLYPILHLLEDRELLDSSWEDEQTATRECRRPRRQYWLSPRGAEQAEAAIAEARPDSDRQVAIDRKQRTGRKTRKPFARPA